MKVSDLTKSEQEIWQAAVTGVGIDLQSGQDNLDSPERWSEWTPERTVRSEVIAALLIGDGEAASITVRGIRLRGARITGELTLEATTLRCPLALVECSFSDILHLEEATARSVRLSGSHLPAVQARLLRTSGDLTCNEGFSVSEGIDLTDAHIGGQLSCRGGKFSHPEGIALNAEGLTVDGDMFCDEGFEVTGTVRLPGAHIGGQLSCSGGKFSHPEGDALSANGLTVDGDMFCGQGFVATGAVDLRAAHIGGQLSCRGGQFSHPGNLALSLESAAVDGPLYMETAVLEGIFDLTAAKARSYHDERTSWPQTLRLNGFAYEAISDTSTAKERLEWLRRNESGYSPQIYEQLAAVYHRTGKDEDARYILIAKQRRRFAKGNLAHKFWGFLLDWTVGYGYRTWLALVWVAGLLVLGTVLFGYISADDLIPANKTVSPSPFQPFLYTLDLLLPVASLHQRDGWVAHGAALWWSVFFILMGWILATAIALSLTGLLKRDVL